VQGSGRSASGDQRHLAKDPRDRQRSAHDLGRSLQQAQVALGLPMTEMVLLGSAAAGPTQPVTQVAPAAATAAPPPTAAVGGPPPAKNRTPLIVGIAVGVIVILLIAFLATRGGGKNNAASSSSSS